MTKAYELSNYTDIDGQILVKRIRYIGGIYHEDYSIGSRFHRLDGPAIIYYSNGSIITETYINEGKKHRVDGPAFINHVKNIKEYYVDNIDITDLVQDYPNLLNDFGRYIIRDGIDFISKLWELKKDYPEILTDKYLAKILC